MLISVVEKYDLRSVVLLKEFCDAFASVFVDGNMYVVKLFVILERLVTNVVMAMIVVG